MHERTDKTRLGYQFRVTSIPLIESHAREKLIEMRSLLLSAVLASTGCSAVFGLQDPNPREDAHGSGGGIHIPDAIAADARDCWATGIQHLCFTTPPSGDLTLAGAYDTTAGAMCASEFTDQCVIAAGTITVAASTTFAVSGSRPLVLVASDQITIAGTLDAASHTATRDRSGPGASGAACTTFSGPPPSDGGSDGTGGGAGASFGSVGGKGGGNASNAVGGGVSTVVTGKEFRAGCPGQGGGTFDAMWGFGGTGGGAVYLIGANAVAISGAVDASGASGRGGLCTQSCGGQMDTGKAHGGGGGGSGGMIVIESPTITNTGMLFADGGGGGEGATHTFKGVDGLDPSGLVVALGGDHPDPDYNGGKGGNGAHAGTSATLGDEGTNSQGGAGGGGGGGGAGKIVVYGGTLTGTFSPAPTP